MKLHTRLTLLLAIKISALLHQPVSRIQQSQELLLPRDDLLLPIHSRTRLDTTRGSLLPLAHNPSRLQKRGNCLSQACKENSSRAQSQLQRTSRESLPKDLTSASSRSRSPANGSPSRSIESSRSIVNGASDSGRDQAGLSGLPPNGQPPRYPGGRHGQTLPLEDFGTRFRRAKQKNNLLQSAVYTGPGGTTPPSSQRQSVDSSSRVSSLGAESLAPKSGSSAGSKS